MRRLTSVKKSFAATNFSSFSSEKNSLDKRPEIRKAYTYQNGQFFVESLKDITVGSVPETFRFSYLDQHFFWMYISPRASIWCFFIGHSRAELNIIELSAGTQL